MVRVWCSRGNARARGLLAVCEHGPRVPTYAMIAKPASIQSKRVRPKLSRVRICLSLIVGALAGFDSAAAAGVDIDVRRTEGTVVVGASAELNADPATAWRVLTDYGRYSEFVPGMRESHVVERRGAHATVAQSAEAPVWFSRMPIDITYEIDEFPPSRIESTAKADALRTLDSRYELLPAPGGVRLEYEGRLAPRSAWFGPIEQYALRQAIASEFQALADRIEQEAAGGR